MRSLFLLLLLANVAIYGLGQGWFGQALSQRGREPERLSQEIRPESIEVPRVAGVNAGNEVTEPPAPASPAAPQASPVPPAPAETATPEPQEPAPTPESPAAPAAPATTSDSGVAAPLLVQNTSAAGASAIAPASLSVLAPPASEKPVCLEWGAFNESELPAARRWSRENLPGVTVNSRRVDNKAGWMVYIPPAPSASAAQMAVAQLSKRGLKDLFVIQEGPYQHAISLGVFRTEEAANKMLAALPGQGVRNAKAMSRGNATGKTWLVMRDLSSRQRDMLQTAGGRFGKPSLRSCQT